jgi:superfamily II DNA or RNA helicase
MGTTATIARRGTPAIGDLVNVRQRRFVVTAIKGESLPPTDTRGALAPEHLVMLSSVDDDGAGEELEVLWEIEPGAFVIERASLPDPTRGVDPPGRVHALLDAIRWGAIASGDTRTLHAPLRSGISLEDYQLDPVARAITMPRANLLIADDVGLGKTIEAGLVVQELLLRHRARSVLVLCPAGLQLQWQSQMREKFGLDFNIIDSESVRELRRARGPYANPFAHWPRAIVSIDYVKRERPLRLLRDVAPDSEPARGVRRFDLLIVDEAHNVAPPGKQQHADDSKRTHAVRTIAARFEHKLFLTATPHNGNPESFQALLELLDDQRFHRGIDLDPAQLAAVMVRRLKVEVDKDVAPEQRRFATRELRGVELDPDADELEAYKNLDRYGQLRRESADAGESQRVAAEFVLKLLKKRLFSSPAAFAKTLAKHVASFDARDRPARSSAAPKRESLWWMSDPTLDEDPERDDVEDADDRVDEAVSAASGAMAPLSARERALLESLSAWAERATRQGDARWRAFLQWIDARVRPSGRFADKRVIVFTEFKDTLDWLHQRLTHEGFGQSGPRKEPRMRTIWGGMNRDEREAVKHAFQSELGASDVRVLLATDAASEGIDLQNHCATLLHYEIPWNPNRLEQRNGRIDRHGQRERVVEVHHFVPKGWTETLIESAGVQAQDLPGDLEFLARIARRVQHIREDLGSVGAVLQSELEERMTRRASSAARLATLQAARDHAQAQTRLAKKKLEVERDLRKRFDELRAQLRETREKLGAEPQRVRAVVDTALELATIPPLKERPGGAFDVPQLDRTWARCAAGLAHPHTGARRPITFAHEDALHRDDVVLAHLLHPLVQRCAGLLRAELWAPDTQRKLQRVTAVRADDSLASPVLVAFARLVLFGGAGSGAEGERLHEELLAVAVRLDSADGAPLERLNVTQCDAITARLHRWTEPLMTADLAPLVARWDAAQTHVLRALEARAKDRVSSVHKSFEAQGQVEQQRVRSVLEELRSRIGKELTQPGSQLAQGELFVDADELRAQSERWADTLRSRWAQIPDEIARETARIARRYHEPKDLLFPVALVFALPPS